MQLVFLDRHIQYLYAYIALLITLPFLQRMAKSLSNKEYIYLIGLMFVFSSFLPLTQYYIWQGEHYLNGNLNPGWLFLNIVFYPCLGYFLQCRCEKIWNKKRIALLWLVNILVIWITCYMTYYKASITGVCEEAQSQDFHFAFVYVNCISIFITCQYFFKKVIVGNNIQTLIRSLGECTFGIYLIHSFFLKMPVMIMIFDALQMKYEINPMVSALIFSFLIFMTSYFVIVIIKKIPVLQKLC